MGKYQSKTHRQPANFINPLCVTFFFDVYRVLTKADKQLLKKILPKNKKNYRPKMFYPENNDKWLFSYLCLVAVLARISSQETLRKSYNESVRPISLRWPKIPNNRLRKNKKLQFSQKFQILTYNFWTCRKYLSKTFFALPFFPDFVDI